MCTFTSLSTRLGNEVHGCDLSGWDFLTYQGVNIDSSSKIVTGRTFQGDGVFQESSSVQYTN